MKVQKYGSYFGESDHDFNYFCTITELIISMSGFLCFSFIVFLFSKVRFLRNECFSLKLSFDHQPWNSVSTWKYTLQMTVRLELLLKTKRKFTIGKSKSSLSGRKVLFLIHPDHIIFVVSLIPVRLIQLIFIS